MHDHSMPIRHSFAFNERTPDPSRGEIAAWFCGRKHILCLTLGALAELEARLAGELMSLPERAKAGKLTITDVVSVIGAGLRGGGTSFSDIAVGKTFLDGGLRGAEATATRLIEATFGKVA